MFLLLTISDTDTDTDTDNGNDQSLVTNIDKVLERGEKIELLVDKTERLESQAVKFRQKAKEVRQTFCWQSWRNTVLLTVIVLVCDPGPW